MKRSIRLALVLITIAPFALAEKNPPLEVSLDPRRIAPVEGGPLVTYADVLGRATPSVVAVYTAQIVTTWQSQQLSDIFRYFGRPVPLPDSQDIARERKEPLGVGSGVIISEDGYIITNYHVVQGMRGREADEIKVQLGDGTEYEATLIGWDAKTDVAVLKIEVEEPLPAVSLADSDRLRVGRCCFRDRESPGCWSHRYAGDCVSDGSPPGWPHSGSGTHMRTLFRPTRPLTLGIPAAP
jgi:S1-C subfamily serine protease